MHIVINGRLLSEESISPLLNTPRALRGWHAVGMTGVWSAVLRQHKSDRQNGVAKPQSAQGRQLLSKGALDAGSRFLSPLLKEGGMP